MDEESPGVILKSFDQPDDVRHFSKGKFETVRLGGMTIGRATYQPGWKWSVDVGPGIGEKYCTVEHVGMVVAGTATAAFADGRVTELTPGSLFYVSPVGAIIPRLFFVQHFNCAGFGLMRRQSTGRPG